MTEDNGESFCEIDHHGAENWRDKNGLLHRANDAAYVTKQSLKIWYWHGEIHRLDGPAWIINGRKLYFIYGQFLSKEDFDNWVQNNGTEWNDELKTLFKLSYS